MAFSKDQIFVITQDARCCLSERVSCISKLHVAGEPVPDEKIITERIAYSYVHLLERHIDSDSCLTDQQICDIIEDLGAILGKCYTDESIPLNYSFILSAALEILQAEDGSGLLFTPIEGLTEIEI